MKFVETDVPIVIGFEGIHRVGKGTQIAMLQSAIAMSEQRAVTLKGDGVRNGLGEHPGDPYSLDWQLKKRALRTASGNTTEAWNRASAELAIEIQEVRRSKPRLFDILLLDRSLLSRTAFLRERNDYRNHSRFRLNDLYPVNNPGLNVLNVLPDVIFDLRVDDPEILMSRIGPERHWDAKKLRNVMFTQ